MLHFIEKRRAAEQSRRRSEFVDVRRYLERNRLILGNTACQKYPRKWHFAAASAANGDVPSAVRIPLLARREWFPDVPVPLEELSLVERSESPLDRFGSPGDILPWGEDRAPMRYSQAIEALHRPEGFEDDPRWRLCSIREGHPAPILEVVRGGHYAYEDTCELLAYETARYSLRKGNPWTGLSGCALRNMLDDPFDLSTRHCILGFNILVFITGENGGPRFVVMEREHEIDDSGGVLYHAMPMGDLPPQGLDATEHALRLVADQLAEEPSMIDRLRAAASSGAIKPVFLGCVLDALTLKPEVLTAILIDGKAWHDLFDAKVAKDARVTVAPLDDRAIYRQIVERPTVPEAMAGLVLAWRHREPLFGVPRPEPVID